jgi:hypothetical protein
MVAALGWQAGCGEDRSARAPADPGAAPGQPSTQGTRDAVAPCDPSPEPIRECGSSGIGFTIIELNEDSGSCEARSLGSDKLDPLYTQWGGYANWSVCNRCSVAIDLRLRGFEPLSLPDIFESTTPPWDSGNVIEVSRVCPQDFEDVSGRLIRPTTLDPTTVFYQFSWRRSGTLAWTDIDPRLEIERDRGNLLDRVRRDWGMGRD